MDLLLDAICVVDARGRFVFVSAAGKRIFGYTQQEMIGRPMIELEFPGNRARTLGAVDEIVAGKHAPNFENRYVRKDGRVVHMMWSARWSRLDGVRVAVARGITERKLAELRRAALYALSKTAHASEDLLALFERVHQIIGPLLEANFFVALFDADAGRLSFPYFVDDHKVRPVPTTLDADTLSAEVIRSRREVLVRCGPATSDPSALQPNVGRDAVDWLGVPLRAQQGIIGALIVKIHSSDARYSVDDIELLKFVSAQVADAVERKQTELRMRNVAQHDPLTDLANRNLVRDQVLIAMARVRRDRATLPLLYLDLDTFKQVNDGFGHRVGDSLLQQVAQRLKHCVRKSDTVGRMGGDEFVVLRSHLRSPVAEKIRLALCQPIEVAGEQLLVSPALV